MAFGNLSRLGMPVVLGGVFIGAAMTVARGGPSSSSATKAGSDLPMKAIDLRPVFKNWGLASRSQGGRGTCSAFVVTGALEYAKACMNDAAWIDFDTAGASRSTTQSSRDVLNLFGPAPVGRNRRVSSNQQPDWHSENLDMIWLQPGESIEMPLLEGPGVITHIWFTSHAGWVGELNALSLRIYWDRRKEPGVEAPVGDFFAVGQGKPAVVESVPVQVSPNGGADLLLADAVPRVGADRGHERQSRSRRRSLLAGRLDASGRPAGRHAVLPRPVSPGIPGRAAD